MKHENHPAIRRVVFIISKIIAMKLKKNHDKNINQKRNLFFVIALLVILLLIYIALEWKTTETNNGYDISCFSKQIIPENHSSTIRSF